MVNITSLLMCSKAICHLVKDEGDLDVIVDTLESGRILELYNKNWYAESLYLLAMVDYLSRGNGLPLFGFRELTYDIDAIIFAEPSMKEAIDAVVDKLGLPHGWQKCVDIAQQSYFIRSVIHASLSV